MSDGETRRFLVKKLLAPIGTLAVIILAIVALFATSYGWFSENAEAAGRGLRASVGSDTSLIIGKTAAEVTDVPVFRSDLGSVTQDTAGTALIAVTQDTASPSRLKYVKASATVDPVTGEAQAKDGNPYAAAVNDGTHTYYVDVTVYLGAAAADLSYRSLTVKLTSGKETGENAFRNAVCVDVYVGEPGNGGVYKGTLSLDDPDTAVTLAESGVLSQSAPMRVTQRCYFDGAKKDGDGNYYLRAATADSAALSLELEFFAD